MDIKYIKLALKGFNHYWIRRIDRDFNTNFCRPVVVLLYLTNACNSNCRYCSLPHESEPDELMTEEWKEIITELKKWLGVFYLNLCGGEPFLRKDIFEIIKFANDSGVITDVTTNGSLLDDTIIKKIIDYRLPKIILSLEGIGRKTHDELRAKGQFDKIISAINLLKKERINVTLNTVINRYNLEELPSLVKFVYDSKLNGIRFVEVRVEFIKDEALRRELWPDRNRIDYIINELVKLKCKGYPILNSFQNLVLIREYFLGSTSHFKTLYCNLPYDQLCIASNGDILPCFLANHFYVSNLGNLKQNKPGHLWRSRTYVESRRQRRYCNRNCMMGEGYLANEDILSNIKRFQAAFMKQNKP